MRLNKGPGRRRHRAANRRAEVHLAGHFRAASAFTVLLTIAQAAPAMAGPLTTFQNLLTAPDAGYLQNGLNLGEGLFTALITCSIVVRLGRLAWANHGSFSGWHSDLGDLIWNVMIPGYATMFGAWIVLPQIPAVINAVSSGVTGKPGLANPDAIFMLGISTAAEMLVGAVVSIATAAPGLIPLFGLDVVWMTVINVVFAFICGIMVVFALTRVAFEMVAAIAGGLFTIAIGSVSVAFAGAGATREIAMRYLNVIWIVVMNVVAIVAYAAIVTDLFASIPFAAGLLNAGTFIQSLLSLVALSYAAGAGAKRVANIGQSVFGGGVFLTTGHVANEAMAAPRAAARVAIMAGKAAMSGA
jgi:hypothetical protein